MKRKIRVDLKKNRSKPARDKTWTRGFEEHNFAEESTHHGERVRTKGELSRKRTILQDSTQLTTDSTTAGELPAVDKDACFPGRVLRIHGLFSVVETDDGHHVGCTVRRLLKTLATDARNVVAAGDRVWIRLGEGEQFPDSSEPVQTSARAQNPSELPFHGVIYRIENRHGVLKRSVRGKEHVLVANLDQVIFVVSVVEPELKVHLVDRWLGEVGGGSSFNQCKIQPWHPPPYGTCPRQNKRGFGPKRRGQVFFA